MEVDLKQTLPNSGMTTICKGLLNKYTSKQIGEEEFEFEVACCALESLAELKYTKMPPKPLVLDEFARQKNDHTYKRLDIKEREAIDKRVADKQEVQDYINTSCKRLWGNKANAEWLEHLMRVFLNKGDKVFAAKVWEVYNGYPDTLYSRDDEHELWKKKKF